MSDASSPYRPSSSVEDASDPTSLQRAMQRREDARRVQDAQFAAEKRQIVRKSEVLQVVLGDADETLARQSQYLSTVARETAEAAAERTRQLTSRNALVHKLSGEVGASERETKEIAARVEELEQAIVAQRLLLGQTQLQVEERQQQSVAAARQLADEENRQAASLSAAEAQRAVQLPERRRLENRANELLLQGSALGESTREIQTAIPAAENRRNELRATAKRRIDSLRDQGSDDASVVRSLRSLLQDLADSQDEAARRRRRVQDEDTKERVASRRQMAQEFAGQIADLERRLRAKTDALAQEAQTKATHLALEALPQLREDCRALFAVELERRDAIAAHQRQIVGIEAIEERIVTAKEQERRLGAAIADLEDQCQIADATITERDRRIAIFQESVAPLADVEDSCADLAARQRELSKQLADEAADQAVWKVRSDETILALEKDIAMLKTDCATMADKKVAEQRACDDELQKLNIATRDLEFESRSLSERTAELAERNKALDNTLEHIARQRRQIAEELALRRDAARAAAANLLSQLE